MRDDLRRAGGEGTAEVAAYSAGEGSGQGDCVAKSSMVWSTGEAGAGL